jgi:hypothetical protein
MQKTFYIILFFSLLIGGCTEGSQNKIFKQSDNLLGKDLRVSYVADSGAIVKSRTVRDGKVTPHKDEQGLQMDTTISGAKKAVMQRLQLYAQLLRE